MKTPLIVGASAAILYSACSAAAQNTGMAEWEGLTGWKVGVGMCVSLEGGLAVLTSGDGKQHASLPWVEDARWNLMQAKEGDIAIDVQVADGWLAHGSGQERFTLLVVTYSLMDECFAGAIPLSHGDGSDALALSLQGGGEVSIECFDPTWVGSGGQQCCGYVSALQEGLGACASRFWLHLFACIPASVTVGAGSFAWCVQYCVLPPPFIPPCIKSCLVLGGVAGAGALVACLAGADFAYEECVREKWALYWQNLTNAGCELRRPRI